jgi:hypothetical protein
MTGLAYILRMPKVIGGHSFVNENHYQMIAHGSGGKDMTITPEPTRSEAMA